MTKLTLWRLEREGDYNITDTAEVRGRGKTDLTSCRGGGGGGTMA